MTPPKRQLGLLVTAAIVIANMIGTGVFIGTGFNAAALPDPMTIMILWGIGGVLALCGAACYAELGSMMPRAGGEYVYLREAYHPIVGYMSGWISLTAGFSAPIAAAAKTFARYLAAIVPGLHGEAAQAAIAIALILAITLLHAFDTKLGGRVQAVFTALKVALIALFIGAAFTAGTGSWSHFASEAGGISANLPTRAFAIQLMYIAFAYSGWNAAAYVAGEVENPAKTLPRALLLGTGAVMVLYLLVNVVYFYALPSAQLAGVVEVGAKSADALFGGPAATLITSVIALALISSVSAMVMAGPRVYASMAADRALPRQLGYYSKRGVPSVAVAVQGGLAIAFVLIAKIGELIEFVGFTLQLSAALAVGALFILRRRGMTSEYRTIGYPVTPILFIGMSMWIGYSMISADPKHAMMVLGVLAAGAIAYAAAGNSQPPLPEAQALPDES
jgi:basic amino acid/polyamine antiporter, APA family